MENNLKDVLTKFGISEEDQEKIKESFLGVFKRKTTPKECIGVIKRVFEKINIKPADALDIVKKNIKHRRIEEKCRKT